MPASSASDLHRLLVRYSDLIPRDAGMIHPGAVGSIDEEQFIIIGGTARRSADGRAHVKEPVEFDILGIRQGFGSATRTYCSEAAEVLICHCGRWQISLGPNGEDGRIEISTGDVMSVPPAVHRRAEKLDEGLGFLFSVRGSTDSDSPAWVSAVFASGTGNAANCNQPVRWIDYSSGVLRLKELAPEASEAHSLALDAGAMNPGALSNYVITEAQMVPNMDSPLAADGVEEAGIVCMPTTRDRFTTCSIRGSWSHGFSVRRLTLRSGAYIPMHSRMEAEVLMLQEGTLEVSSDAGAIMMGAGDTLSVPTGLPHDLRNTTSKRVQAFVVRGSEDPAMPVFRSMPVFG